LGAEDRNNFTIVGFFVAVIDGDSGSETSNSQQCVESENETLRPGATTLADGFDDRMRKVSRGAILGLGFGAW
jgi:hypothetical protein